MSDAEKIATLERQVKALREAVLTITRALQSPMGSDAVSEVWYELADDSFNKPEAT